MIKLRYNRAATRRRYTVLCWLWRGGRHVGTWVLAKTVHRRTLAAARRTAKRWTNRNRVQLTDGFRTSPWGSHADILRDNYTVDTVESFENWPSVGTMGWW